MCYNALKTANDNDSVKIFSFAFMAPQKTILILVSEK